MHRAFRSLVAVWEPSVAELMGRLCRPLCSVCIRVWSWRTGWHQNCWVYGFLITVQGPYTEVPWQVPRWAECAFFQLLSMWLPEAARPAHSWMIRLADSINVQWLEATKSLLVWEGAGCRPSSSISTGTWSCRNNWHYDKQYSHILCHCLCESPTQCELPWYLESRAMQTADFQSSKGHRTCVTSRMGRVPRPSAIAIAWA